MTLSIALCLFAVLGIGTATLFHHWYGLMGHQLRLDRCVAEKAFQLRDLNNQIESTNAKIRDARIAAAVGTLLPPARATLTAAAEALALFQDGLLSRWALRQAQWVATRCGDRGDSFGTLPTLSWFRMPPDTLGPQPLSWLETSSRQLRIQARHGPRASAAMISPKEKVNEKLVWHAQWVPVRSLLRPSID